MAFSHRDRRAHRSVGRALAAVLGLVVGLVLVALEMPYDAVGLAAVGGLSAVGLGYLIWSERLLSRYSADLRGVLEGISDSGFVRAEVGTAVGLERAVGSPAGRSPHRRRGPPPPMAGDRGPSGGARASP